jgi:hypothetical protein
VNECHFEIVPLDCIDCGGLTTELGTCRDIVQCPACRAVCVENTSKYATHQMHITLNEVTPYIGTTEEMNDE